MAFISTITDGTKQNTKKLRFTLLSAFFNYVKNSLDSRIQTPVTIRRFESFSEPESAHISRSLKKTRSMRSYSEPENSGIG